MNIINQATAGDHQGLIKFKNWKKGLYIDESKLLRKRLTFINKETVESYELMMNESETSKKGALTKGVLGARHSALRVPLQAARPARPSQSTLCPSSSRMGPRPSASWTPRPTTPF